MQGGESPAEAAAARLFWKQTICRNPTFNPFHSPHHSCQVLGRRLLLQLQALENILDSSTLQPPPPFCICFLSSRITLQSLLQIFPLDLFDVMGFYLFVLLPYFKGLLRWHRDRHMATLPSAPGSALLLLKAQPCGVLGSGVWMSWVWYIPPSVSPTRVISSYKINLETRRKVRYLLV